MNFSEEVITSRQNRTVVELCKLTDRKTREERRLFRFDGIKLLAEAIKNRLELELIALRRSSADRILRDCEKLCAESGFTTDARVVVLSDELFDKISEEKSPEGVICIAKYIDKFEKNITIYNSADFFNIKNERIVLLESVRDPSNVGAIIRSAAAIGVDRIIMSADCADIYHPRAVRASMGTLFNQPITRVDSLPEVIAHLRESGRRVYAAALNAGAKPLGSFVPEAGDTVVIGNEGHGLTAETVAACNGCVIIPMTNRAESFNAAVAASILMWEFIGKQSGF
mgnify:CR=1 FL=1